MPTLAMQMVDEDVMQRAAALLGRKVTRVRPRQVHWQVSYMLRVTGGRAVAWMHVLRPLLGRRRQVQLDRALACYDPRSSSLLDEAQVVEALQALAAGAKVREVAERFGTSIWCIYDLRLGRTYKHVPRPAELADVQVGAQRRDDGVGRVALGDHRADALDAVDHAGGLLGGEGADDREEGGGAGALDPLDLGAIEGRQPEVEDDRVGLELGGHGDRLVPVGGGPHDVEPGVREDGPGQQAKARGVVADEDPGRRRHTNREHRRWRAGSE
jgi:hypothetical protein